MAWSKLELCSLGGMNGIYQIIGDITKPYRTKFQQWIGIRTDCGSYYFFQRLFTFICVDFTWLFFRADGFMAALRMLKHGIQNLGPMSMFSTQTVLGVNSLILSEKDFYVMLVSIAVLMLVDYFKRSIDLKAVLARQNIWFRWLVYYVLIFTILIFGIYGPDYDASTFIYFQF